jgi:hypothetical protein
MLLTGRKSLLSELDSLSRACMDVTRQERDAGPPFPFTHLKVATIDEARRFKGC